MNCQEITRILDDGDIGSMTRDERDEVEAHLFACPDCAADWKIHQRISAGFAPPTPAGLKERARALVVAGEAGQGRSASIRAILVGSILGLAVAAAAFGLKFVSTPSSHDVPTEATVVPAPERSSLSAAAVLTEVAQEVIAGAPESVKVQLASEAALRPQSSTLFTVRIFPLNNGAADAPRDADLDMFYRLLIEELRKVPGLRLLTPESTGHENDPVAHEIRVSRRENAPGRLQMTVMVEIQTRMRPSGGNLSFSGSSSLSMAINWSGSGDVAGQARHVVEQLRQQTFPPDPALQQQQLAILSNSAAQMGLRQQAMENLLRFGMNGTADPAVLRAAMEFATTAADPDVRESVWRRLQMTRSPDLTAAMTKALGTESSAKVRLLLVNSLSRDSRGSAEVRAALESIAQRDPQQLLRMAAQRELGGEAAWNDYMITTLKNPQLTGTQRLEPLVYAVSGGNFNSRQLQLDDDTVRILGQIVAGTGTNSSSADAQQAVNVLANLRTPVARDVLIDIARSGVGRSENGMDLRSAAVRTLEGSYRNDARAREAVDEILANDPDPQLHSMIEQYRNVMQRMPLRP